MSIKNLIHPKYFLILYSSLVFLDIYIENFVLNNKIAITSLFPYLLLLLFFWFNGKKLPKKMFYYCFFAFVFSFIGKTLIFLSDRINDAFLYITIFFTLFNIFLSRGLLPGLKRPTNYRFVIMPLVFLVYGVYIYSKLHENLGFYQTPVIIYIISLFILILIIFGRSKSVDDLSYILVIFGVAFFVIANTLYASNIFYLKSPFIRFFNSTAFVIGLYLIVTGILAQSQKKDYDSIF